MMFGKALPSMRRLVGAALLSVLTSAAMASADGHGAPKVGAAAAVDPDIEACAHAPMDAGLTPACARLLVQCGPRPTRDESRLYLVWHVLVFGAMSALVLLLAAGPFLACACGKRLTCVGGALGANAIIALLWAGVWAGLRTFT